jgi:hypothetical protein
MTGLVRERPVNLRLDDSFPEMMIFGAVLWAIKNAAGWAASDSIVYILIISYSNGKMGHVSHKYLRCGFMGIGAIV